MKGLGQRLKSNFIRIASTATLNAYYYHYHTLLRSILLAIRIIPMTLTNQTTEITPPLIPKTIHYCWLSDDPMPEKIQSCMRTWKEVLPDYEIVRWDMSSFDVTSVDFVSQACSVNKWAFASDYIRLFALYHQGGIYLDSDVLVLRTFDPLLIYPMFTAVEFHPKVVNNYPMRAVLGSDCRPLHADAAIPGIGIQAAVLGSVSQHPFLKTCMEYYEQRAFIREDGSFNTEPIAPGIYARAAENFGFIYKDETQELSNGMHVFASKYFVGDPGYDRKDAFAVHCCAGSWREKRSLTRRVTDRLRHLLNARLMTSRRVGLG